MREIVAFLGDSLTDYVRFDAFFPELATLNFGVEGDTSEDLLSRLDAVIRVKPHKIFVMIGVNDVLSGLTRDETLANIREILSQLHDSLPECKLYLETLLPVNSGFVTRRTNEAIREINAGLAALAQEMQCTLIDTHDIFAENGELPKRFTLDGLHLNGAGNAHWMDFLSRWVHE